MQTAKRNTHTAPQAAQALEIIFTHQAIAPSLTHEAFAGGQTELAVFDKREVIAASGERFIGSVECWHEGHGVNRPKNGLVARLIQSGERDSVTACFTAGDLLDLAAQLLDMACYMKAAKGGVQ